MFKTRHIALIALMGVASCAAAQAVEPDNYTPYQYYPIVPWKDPLYGCEYLTWRDGRGVTIVQRMGNNGTQVCDGDGLDPEEDEKKK